MSEDIFAHYQKHLSVFTVSGSIHITNHTTISCKYCQVLLMMGENVARNMYS